MLRFLFPNLIEILKVRLEKRYNKNLQFKLKFKINVFYKYIRLRAHACPRKLWNLPEFVCCLTSL